jgi:hypothetical protein
VYNVPPSTSPSLASDNFNYTYTSLLGALHVMFNGQNNQAQFNRALGLMMSLAGQAKAMMAMAAASQCAPFAKSVVWRMRRNQRAVRRS